MATNTIESIDPEKARRLIASGEAQAVDVREQEDWDDAHVPGAVRAAPGEFDSAADELDRDRAVIVVAEDKKAARSCAEALRERGFEASLLEGGMDAWKSEDFTIQPSHDPDDDAPVEPETK